ncbi:MAG: hypothetical protein EOO04_05895 [Chitinophagaceae bacterium]|nr:MAG: hypothetical protein EOO04_05895 [Chitinophagaceae bacterium]
MNLRKKGDAGLTRLSANELETINGGDLFPNPVSPLIYYLYKLGKMAADYQSSLPANLKK